MLYLHISKITQPYKLMGFSAIILTIFFLSRLLISEGLMEQVLSSSSYPLPSIFSSVSYYSEKNIAVAYGGTNSKISNIYSSFHYFDFESLSWNEIIPKSSFSPPGLYSSISFVYNNSYYLMFGRTKNQISSQTYQNSLEKTPLVFSFLFARLGFPR